MLVQCSFSDVVEGLEFRAGIALCCKCGAEVGPVSMEELKAMMSGKYGDVICFECENWPPQPFKTLPDGVRGRLLKLFGIEDVALLPIHSNNGWTNDRQDVTLQLSPNFGWCFWIQSPDREWMLKKVRMSADEASCLQGAYGMLPVRLG